MSVLTGVTVVAVEQYGAGPWATLQLADLGATVIKVEDPATGGDVGRYVPPYAVGEDSLFFESFNRGKHSVSLDLKTDEGRAAFRRLAADADVVFCNLRGDQPDRLSLTYEALRHVNPRLVCCSLTGFGRTGPRRLQPAYDYVVQAMSGWMALTGGPSDPPTKSGLSLVDFCGGYVAAIAILGGLHRARSAGVGCDCDVSLLESALSLLNYVGTWQASAGFQVGRLANSAHPSIVPFQAFQTSDGWITIACAKQKFWEALCDALGRSDLREDERFADFAGRLLHRDEVIEQLQATLISTSTADAVQALEGAGVPVAAVNEVHEALRDPQIDARCALTSYEHEALGTVVQPRSPYRIDGELVQASAAPRRGEHNDVYLKR